MGTSVRHGSRDGFLGTNTLGWSIATEGARKNLGDDALQSGDRMEVHEIERIIREHSRLQNKVSQDLWLTPATVARYRDSVPAPCSGETTLMDIGCYQPAIGYYAALGWRTIIGIFREHGECNSPFDYTTEDSAA